MSTRIQLANMNGPLRWPNECAHCGAKGGRLTSVPVGIAREKTHLKDLAQQRLVFESATLTYPVCAPHAGKARLASWLTRRSPLPALLRLLAWLMGPLAMLAGVASLAALVMRTPGAGAGAAASAALPGVFLALMAGAAILLVLVIWAKRFVPLRLLRLTDDGLTLRFANDAYARRFLRANPASARRLSGR